MKKLSSEWKGIKEVVLYGFGAEASFCIDKFISDFTVPFIVDNSPQKAGTTYKNIPIITWENARGKINGRKIVVTTRYRQFYKIKQSLEIEGLTLYEDFCDVKSFVPEWYWDNKKECCLYTIDMTVSAKCNFRCKNCNMFMPYYKTNVQYTLEDLKENIDEFFGVVDYVCYIGFIGGEPLLCTYLDELIEYIASTYAEKVGNFAIHTNGSIFPNEKIIQKILRYGILVAVSDYGVESPCRERMLDHVKKLEEKGVRCDVRSTLEWRNVGFPSNPRSYSDDEVIEHIKMCSADWRAVNDGNFYFCNIAWSAEKGGLTQLEKDDYLSLSELKKDGIDGKQKLLKYSEGEFDKGYISFCKRCGGCGMDNKDVVVPGIQL